MKLRGIIVSVATAGLMVGPAFAHGVFSSMAGARAECTITGTAANDTLFGTTRDDVICAKAGSDSVFAGEGNDIIRAGQGDDGTGAPPCPRTRQQKQKCFTVMHAASPFGLNGEEGSDVIKGQQDDDSLEGQGQNDKLYGGQGDDCLGAQCTATNQMSYYEPGNDFLKSRDRVSGNDYVDGGDNTDRCRIDAGDMVLGCEL
jgi:Ca2+-binding RTX toxin-like protein